MCVCECFMCLCVFYVRMRVCDVGCCVCCARVRVRVCARRVATKGWKETQPPQGGVCVCVRVCVCAVGLCSRHRVRDRNDKSPNLRQGHLNVLQFLFQLPVELVGLLHIAP